MKDEKVELLKFRIRQRHGIACVNFSQEQWLIEALKLDWISNFEAQALVKSGSGDRRLRGIGDNLPQDYRMQKRKKDCPVRCFEYHLVPCGQRSIFEI